MISNSWKSITNWGSGEGLQQGGGEGMGINADEEGRKRQKEAEKAFLRNKRH